MVTPAQPTPAIIFVQVSRDDLRSRCVAALISLPGRLLTSASELMSSLVVDLVVTDAESLNDVLPDRQEELRRGEMTVLAIGSSCDDYDVCLPTDFSDRELQTACRLLAEISRLRRRQQRGDHLHKALTQLAMSDPLTGLANRRAWEEELRTRVQEAQSGGHLLCLAMLDLDRFKLVNDQFGYVAGDEVLRTTAKVLAANLRSRDFVARYGGDEFAIIVSDTLPETARAILERTRQAVCAALAELPYGKVGASIGLAVIDHRDGTSPQELFAAAERALRTAKSSGRDQTAVASTRSESPGHGGGRHEVD